MFTRIVLGNLNCVEKSETSCKFFKTFTVSLFATNKFFEFDIRSLEFNSSGHSPNWLLHSILTLIKKGKINRKIIIKKDKIYAIFLVIYTFPKEQQALLKHLYPGLQYQKFLRLFFASFL